MKKHIQFLTLVIILFFGLDVFAMGRKPKPPGQALTGYGSSENYITDKLLGGEEINHKNSIQFGSNKDGSKCWVYIPETLKNGNTAPVVVYLHGFMVMVPPIYGGQIEHLVRQGYIVIFPEYNEGGFSGLFNDTDQYEMLDRSVKAVDQAFMLPEVMETADTSDITLAGHSSGGLLALCWIAGSGVPVDRIVIQHPNISNDAIPDFVKDWFLKDMVELDYETMAKEITCPVIITAGEDDTVARPEHVRAAYESLINASSKVYYSIKH